MTGLDDRKFNRASSEHQMLIVDEIAKKYFSNDDWVFCSKDAKNGDVFLALSMLDAFRRTHTDGKKVKFLASGETHRQIALLFPDHISEVIFVPELKGLQAGAIIDWNERNSAEGWGPGHIQLIQPWCFIRGGAKAFGLNRLTGNSRSFVDWMKVALRLPFSTVPVLPSLSDQAIHAAADQYEVERGKTLIIFPYAQSFPRDWTQNFEALAQRFRQEKIEVFTSVADGEQPIIGTKPIYIPFRDLRALVAAAGYMVSVRSGISDILSDTTAQGAVIYPSLSNKLHWNTRLLGLYSHLEEIGFADDDVSPEVFADTIFDKLMLGPEVPRPTELPENSWYKSWSFLNSRSKNFDYDELIELNQQNCLMVDNASIFGKVILGYGWDVESHGSWSVGRHAILYLQAINHDMTKAKALILEGFALISEESKKLGCKILIDGKLYGSWEWKHGQDASFSLQLLIPNSLRTSGLIEVLFSFDNPTSPARHSKGASGDKRPLGIMVKRISIIN
jgi:hypothetical protein